MAESKSPSGHVAFDDTDARADQMHQAIDQWLAELVDAVDAARASEQFQQWLDVQSNFHDYSHRNTLLITLQCPDATKVAGYRTWQDEFDRHVKAGESAIWIWAPIITNQCPECGDGPTYHEASDCRYDETPPDEWETGVVGFKPVSVFDVSQTDGEPLPELATSAQGDADGLVTALLEAAADLGITVEILESGAWPYGDADGVCRHVDGDPHVQVRDDDTAAVAGTLLHEYAHALLHGSRDAAGQEAREREAEAVAYVVGRHFELEMDGSARYLAAWSDDTSEQLLTRCERIRDVSTTLIDAIETR
ncbi:ArdC-like ssDNA-binding domain-containing protein [Halorubrum sp. AD140]|uniref:ArdC-like ssDNA-binding domain-containing protein n=1 Tax=Halorubrum sp. AD140 TaxID=3050073 RepID=UPI002ACCA8C0|nr:ArdC-like ssDNA-binding domain-containing protein [Halorubrum sp. AD140]MDZ5812655.1 ArdC-like ssDNA-binding domain-containing protein [Halorubrum sp. AD140]